MFTEIQQVKNLMNFLNSVDIEKFQLFSEFDQTFVNKFIENYENIFGEKLSFDFTKKMEPLVRYIGKCGLKSNSHHLIFSFGSSHVVYDTEINELFAGTIVDNAFHYFEFKNNSLSEFIFDKTIVIDLGLNAVLKKHNGKQNILKQEIVVNKILNKYVLRIFSDNFFQNSDLFGNNEENIEDYKIDLVQIMQNKKIETFSLSNISNKIFEPIEKEEKRINKKFMFWDEDDCFYFKMKFC